MELHVFPAPAVAGLLKGMIEARLHTDTPDEVRREQNMRLQRELTDSVATPIYVVQDPVSGTRLVGPMKPEYFSAESFADFLRRASEKITKTVGGERT